MSHLPFTLLAYFLNGVAVTVDKFLLTKHIPDPLIYIFYYSVVSLIALVLIPFVHIPNTEVLILASISTLLWTIGAYFMFKALQIGVLSRVIPIIGTLIPIFLLIDAEITGKVTLQEAWTVVLLIFGLVFLTIFDWKGKISFGEIILEIASALFFAVSYLILKQAYLQEDFLTVFVWTRPVLIPIGVLILAIPLLRRRVLTAQGPKINPFTRVGALFMAGQACGGISELLLTFSVSLATPALVNSLQGTQYAFLFVFSLILSRKFPQIYHESTKSLILLSKIIGIILIAFGLFMLTRDHSLKQSTLGVTYSPRYAQNLGLDPQKTYLDSLDNLGVKYLRLPLYWDEVENKNGQMDFSQADFYLSEAQKRDVSVVLVVGFKQPRWPECFAPDWAVNLSNAQFDQAVLDLVQKEVEYFKKYPNIKIWQVENEPFLEFGQCPKPNPERLKKEIELVRSFDQRPVLITESGELSNWMGAVRMADILGISLYRTVWNPIFGKVTYPLPPFFYNFKNTLVKKITGSKTAQTIISELQAEPWATKRRDLRDIPISEQVEFFKPDQLKKNVTFAKGTGFPEIYFWGIEWWYYMEKNGQPQYLEQAKKLFQNP